MALRHGREPPKVTADSGCAKVGEGVISAHKTFPVISVDERMSAFNSWPDLLRFGALEDANDQTSRQKDSYSLRWFSGDS